MIVKVIVPLHNNIEVTCTEDVTRQGYWLIDPPIPHPAVCPCNTEMFCSVGDTPQQLLQQKDPPFRNPCNLDLAVLAHRDPNAFKKKMQQLHERECFVCFEEFERSFEFKFLCSNNHQCCDRGFEKIEQCPMCREVKY